MRKKFNLYFMRPEPIVGKVYDVPDDWDEWDEEDRMYWLTEVIEGMRWLEVEEYDEEDV